MKNEAIQFTLVLSLTFKPNFMCKYEEVIKISFLLRLTVFSKTKLWKLYSVEFVMSAEEKKESKPPGQVSHYNYLTQSAIYWKEH